MFKRILNASLCFRLVRKDVGEMLKQLIVVAVPVCIWISEYSMKAAVPDEISFSLTANPRFAQCLARDPAGPAPSAEVTVSRGTANDVMVVELRHFRSGLTFSLFTVQRSQLKSDGTLDADFQNFGLAWYHSDIHVGDDGRGEGVVKSILLDDIFGFDADPLPGSATGAPLVAPTHTFHVGIWFDDPQDAVACGFDATKPTPFNGDHKAGPNAMISLPDPASSQGPLFTPAPVTGYSTDTTRHHRRSQR